MEAARLRRVRDRRGSGQALIEGPHILEAALQAGVSIGPVFALADDETTHRAAVTHALDLVVVSRDVLGKVADTKSPRGPVAVIDTPHQAAPTRARLLVLWEVSDPGNLGTILRSAAAFGFDAWVAGGADPWSPKALRSAAGAHFQTGLRWGSSPEIGELHSAGYRVVASVAENGLPPVDLVADGHRDAVLIGSEAHGLPASIVRRADALVTIPMPGGTESLNAAVAASILMYSWSSGA